MADRFDTRTVEASQEAEQALLGAILVNNAALDRDGVAMLRPEHFSSRVHGAIFAAIREFVDAGRLADHQTLRPHFAADPALESVGGARYLARLAAASTTIINAEHYAQAVRDAHVRRRLLDVAVMIEEHVLRPDAAQPLDDVLSECEGALAAVSDGLASCDRMAALAKAADEAIRQAEAAYKAEGRITGVTTGLVDLDRALGGLHGTELVVLAGRPAMGKTSLAVDIARAAAVAEMGKAGPDASPGVVAFFSLEMSSTELAMKVLAGETAISSERVRSGRIGQLDFQMLLNARDDLDALPLFVDDSPAASVGQIRLKARRLARRRPLRLVVVDYLQLIRGSGKAENRVQEVTEFTRGLKLIAKEFGCPVLALSQLSRKVEDRDDKRPLLSDLRESGSIEQDADVVLFVYRDEYYLAQREPRRSERETEESHANKVARWTQQMDQCRGLAEIIVAKNRHGASGRTVNVRFDAERTRFQNLAR
jgi:replicative DNA helicase